MRQKLSHPAGRSSLCVHSERKRYGLHIWQFKAHHPPPTYVSHWCTPIYSSGHLYVPNSNPRGPVHWAWLAAAAAVSLLHTRLWVAVKPLRARPIQSFEFSFFFLPHVKSIRIQFHWSTFAREIFWFFWTIFFPFTPGNFSACHRRKKKLSSLHPENKSWRPTTRHTVLHPKYPTTGHPSCNTSHIRSFNRLVSVHKWNILCLLEAELVNTTVQCRPRLHPDTTTTTTTTTRNSSSSSSTKINRHKVRFVVKKSSRIKTASEKKEKGRSRRNEEMFMKSWQNVMVGERLVGKSHQDDDSCSSCWSFIKVVYKSFDYIRVWHVERSRIAGERGGGTRNGNWNAIIHDHMRIGCVRE